MERRKQMIEHLANSAGSAEYLKSLAEPELTACLITLLEYEAEIGSSGNSSLIEKLATAKIRDLLGSVSLEWKEKQKQRKLERSRERFNQRMKLLFRRPNVIPLDPRQSGGGRGNATVPGPCLGV